jgi:hypothetical protein
MKVEDGAVHVRTGRVKSSEWRRHDAGVQSHITMVCAE